MLVFPLKILEKAGIPGGKRNSRDLGRIWDPGEKDGIPVKLQGFGMDFGFSRG